MSGILSKKRPLSRYLKDYKHSQTHYSQCGKLLDRMVLVFRGKIIKIINKNAIMRMDQPIDDAIWLSLQPELAGQCRFCSKISCKSHADYFDIMAFKQYLFQHIEMNHSTIREYVVRLRRLDEMLVVRDYPAEKFASSSCHQHIIDGLPLVAHVTYRIALRKYEQFLAWRRSC